MKLDIVLYIVLDSSTDTGEETFDLVKQLLAVLARSYVAGEGGLKLYVLLHRNGRTRVIRLANGARKAAFLAEIQAVQYTPSPPNVVAVFRGLAGLVQAYGTGTMQAKAIVLIGGYRLPGGAHGALMQYIQVRTAVVRRLSSVETVTNRTSFSFTGSQVSTVM